MHDSILLNDDEFFLHDIKSELSYAFEMTNTSPIEFCLGIQVMKNVTNHSIHLSQEKYLTYIFKCFGMMDCKLVNIPLPTRQKLTKEMESKDIHEADLMKTMPYAKAIGCLMYAMTSTRPNLIFSIGQVAQFMANPRLVHWIIVKHIFHYIQATKDIGIKYDGKGSDMLKIQGWTDSHWARDQEFHKSTSKYIFLLVGSAISWQCKKQTTVALSSTKAK